MSKPIFGSIDDAAPHVNLTDKSMWALRQVISEELNKRFVRVTTGCEHTEMPTFTATQYNELMNLYLQVHEEYQKLHNDMDQMCAQNSVKIEDITWIDEEAGSE